MKRLSIVVPLYNKEKYIIECIESVINCKYDIEVIVIDDGSTDNSFKLVNKYIKSHKDKNIKLIKQKNSGPSTARNKGVELANGKYLLFLDADDFFNVNSINYLLEEMDKKDYDLLEFGFTNTKIEACKPVKKKEYYSNEEMIKDMLNGKNIKPLVWGALLKTDICKKCNFNENMRWGEDSCYKLDYINLCNSGVCISNPYYVNRILYDNTLSRQKISKKMINSIISYIEYYEEKLSNIECLKSDLYNKLFKTCVLHIKMCKESSNDDLIEEILLLEEKCNKFKKNIKLNSYKHYILYIVLKYFPNLYKKIC